MTGLSLSPEQTTKLDEFLKKNYEGGDVPAVMAGLTTADKELYYGNYGDRRYGEPESGPADDHTILQLFSMTKLVTAVAVMQQVEKGLLTLDDPEVLEKYCPEIGKLPICQGYGADGKPILVRPKNKVTLRMLLDHTSGMCYDFTAPSWLPRYKKDYHLGERIDPDADIPAFTYPLTHEPGARWTYSIGLDWAGFLLERLLGKDLETIFKDNIWSKCGVTSLTFYPPRDKSYLFGMCGRKDGKVVLTDVGPFPRAMDPERVKIFAGGSGLFGTARDYLTFLRHLIASAKVGHHGGLLEPETFKLLFANSIPRTPEVRKSLATFARFQRQYDPSFVEDDEAEHITFGLSLMVYKKDSCFGRKAGSGSWDGAAKSMFWIDPQTGVAGVYCTNLSAVSLQSQDPFLRTYNEYERLVYDSLEAGGGAGEGRQSSL